MGRVYEKWHICKCLVFHAENLVKVYTQKNSGYTKSRRKIRQQKIPKINSKFLHIEVLSREAWASKDTRFLTLSSWQLKVLAKRYRIPVETVYPHSFRHRFAKNFLSKFNDISLLADLMGHESIETTRIYYDKQILMASCPGGYTVLLKYPPEQLSIINASIH